MQQLCIQHLAEHNASLISQLNPLTDEINALGDRLQSLNIQNLVGDCHRKLEEWRRDCHKKIDHIFEQKCQEFDRLINEKIKKEKVKIDQIRLKMSEFIREQETTRQDIDSLTSTIRQLQRNMDNIEQTGLQIDIRPLLIGDGLIYITERNERMIDLLTLSPLYKTINRPAGDYISMATNDRFLLLHQKPNLCLIDRELNIAKQTLWSDGTIFDMCWSSTLNRFIVVAEQRVFLVDENTMTIDNMKTIDKRNWLSCTCSETSLFLSTNEYSSCILEYSLSPLIELVNERKSPDTCAQDEIIYGIVYNNEKLALLIMNKSKKSLRLELRHAETFDRIWSLQFDTECSQTIAFRCCSLTCNEWLVVDYETKRLLQITKDGKLKATIPYDAIPYRANLFANMLVLIRNGGLNFYKL
jgi:hypothetical protein